MQILLSDTQEDIAKTTIQIIIIIKGKDGDCVNFVHRCLKEGGFDASGCTGYKDDKGMLINYAGLRACLQHKVWKYTRGVSNKFKRGFPFFNGEQHAMKATEVSVNVITFCGHTNDRCDYQIVADSYDYFYF